MSLWSRIANVFRGDRLSREINEELRAHIEDAVEQGRDPEEARRAFGSVVRQREASRDVKLLPWLDSVRADVIFGSRQLLKRKTTSAAAILSLGLSIGACTSAFRLIDALLFRPMPIVDPGHVYGLFFRGISPGGQLRTTGSNEYPQFLKMRAAVRDQAELMAVSWVERIDLTYGADDQMEKAYRQYVSGGLFRMFGLQPAVGRLLMDQDDASYGAYPYAVLSYDYWSRRFGRDPHVLGRTCTIGNEIYQIIGVGPKGFTGTEPGTMTDLFLPVMMYAGVLHDDWSWIRTFVRLKPGVRLGPVREKLQAVFDAVQAERSKRFVGWPRQRLRNFLNQKALLEPASQGISGMQEDYRPALIALAALVALVLLIACANIANLMTAQAAARSREMALRVSIGAGRLRLVQLVMVESALLALCAACAGALFAWWSAPFVVARINPPDNPARLALPADWRVLVFASAITIGITLLLGLMPALRASHVLPANALRGDSDPRSKGRFMLAMIAAQVAFCVAVLFVAGLFVATLDRLASEPTGFAARGLLVLDTVAKQPQRYAYWDQVAAHLRTLPGVENVALASWALMNNNGANGFLGVNGAPPHPILAYFLNVSPGWLDAMKIPLVDGRDFRNTDMSPGVAIVNEAFSREYFNGQDPVGRTYDRKRTEHVTIVGLARNARYRDLREPITPTAYLPLESDTPIATATFLVRTSAPDPLSLAPMLRQEIERVRSDFRVSNTHTQEELVRSQTVRERLLAMLATFFAAVALLLAGIGLYGVLDYSVLQRRREIGIRMAIGAPASDIARRVALGILVVVCFGAAAGLALGLFSARYVASLFYQVRATDLTMLVIPALTMVIAAILAALPAVFRAVRIDPNAIMRSE